MFTENKFACFVDMFVYSQMHVRMEMGLIKRNWIKRSTHWNPKKIPGTDQLPADDYKRTASARDELHVDLVGLRR